MTRRPRTRRFWLAAALVTVVAIAIPTAGTLAQLTSQKSTTSTVGTGDWCATPDTSSKKNVYKLSDFTSVAAPEHAGGSTDVRMLVLPVVNDGSYAPTSPLPSQIQAADNQLGIRLWSCTSSMSSTGNFKATAWRGAYGTNPFTWTTAPTKGSFAQARLNANGTPALNAATTPQTNPGMELRDLHRSLNGLGGTVQGVNPVTSRYSWLFSSGRSKGTNYTADPSCATTSCVLNAGSGVAGYNNAFSGDPSAAASSAVSANSTTYLAETYGSQSTTTKQVCQQSPWWPENWTDTTLSPCPTYGTSSTQYRVVEKSVTTNSVSTTPRATTLADAGASSADALVRDTTGTKLQWVVLEWWGGAPSADMAVEVFVV